MPSTRPGRPPSPRPIRQYLHATVAPETLAAIIREAEERGESRGQVLDRAVQLLRVDSKA